MGLVVGGISFVHVTLLAAGAFGTLTATPVDLIRIYCYKVNAIQPIMLLGFSVSPASLPAIPCRLARAAAAMHSLLVTSCRICDAFWCRSQLPDLSTRCSRSAPNRCAYMFTMHCGSSLMAPSSQQRCQYGLLDRLHTFFVLVQSTSPAQRPSGSSL